MTRKASGMIHIRDVEVSESGRMSQQFIKSVSPTGGFSLAYNVLENGDVVVGVADCSDRDHFNKNLGSKIAIGRLNCDRDVANRLVLSKAEVLGDTGLDYTPKLGDDGYYVDEREFKMYDRLLETVGKDVVADSINRFYAFNKVPASVGPDAVRFEYIGKTLVWELSDEAFAGLQSQLQG